VLGDTREPKPLNALPCPHVAVYSRLGQPVMPGPVIKRLSDTIGLRPLILENIPTVQSTGTALVDKRSTHSELDSDE